MGLYQFHFFDAEGRRPMLDFAECVDDGGAVSAASINLRQHISCSGVEIYEGDRLVSRIERPGDAWLLSKSGIHGAG